MLSTVGYGLFLSPCVSTRRGTLVVQLSRRSLASADENFETQQKTWSQLVEVFWAQLGSKFSGKMLRKAFLQPPSYKFQKSWNLGDSWKNRELLKRALDFPKIGASFLTGKNIMFWLISRPR